jgi:hypothetical protein
MQKLETEIMLSGRILRQLKRGRKCALYAVHNKADTLYGHEVIRIKIAEPVEAFGQHYPLRELYPGNEEWGRLAWSYGTTQTAEAEKPRLFAKAGELPNHNQSRDENQTISRNSESETGYSQPATGQVALHHTF